MKPLRNESSLYNGFTNNVDYESLTTRNSLNYEKRQRSSYAGSKDNGNNPGISSKSDGNFKHFIAGGIAGGVASTVTCPLEVIKTRQQSSGHVPGWQGTANTNLTKYVSSNSGKFSYGRLFKSRRMLMSHVTALRTPNSMQTVSRKAVTFSPNLSILQHCRYIINVEGPRSLYKGLGITLIAVIPTRATYFYAYSCAKDFYKNTCGLAKDSSRLHLVSAASAGLICTTTTSPIWVIKTKLQLHRNVNGTMNIRECFKKIWQAQGYKGFYRGITASYAGTLETVIHLVIYERLKLLLQQQKEISGENMTNSGKNYVALMTIACISKTIATSIAYPHEVVRTRLREETKQRRYYGFFQTLSTVARQEGVKALYRGLITQVIRQVPNVAIVMGTWEFFVDMLSKV